MSENEIEGRMSAEDSEDSEGDERSCPDSFEHEKMVLILAREKDTRPHLATMRRRDLTGIPRDELRRAVYIGLNSSAIMKGAVYVGLFSNEIVSERGSVLKKAREIAGKRLVSRANRILQPWEIGSFIKTRQFCRHDMQHAITGLVYRIAGGLPDNPLYRPGAQVRVLKNCPETHDAIEKPCQAMIYCEFLYVRNMHELDIPCYKLRPVSLYKLLV